jgi:hypothetical protein
LWETKWRENGKQKECLWEKWQENEKKIFVRDEMTGERKNKKSVCEKSEGKTKNNIFVTDDVTGERKTKSVSVRDWGENEKQKLRLWARKEERTKEGKVSLLNNRIIKMVPQPGKLCCCTETTNIPFTRWLCW